jgi:hypothetical protein
MRVWSSWIFRIFTVVCAAFVLMQFRGADPATATDSPVGDVSAVWRTLRATDPIGGNGEVAKKRALGNSDAPPSSKPDADCFRSKTSGAPSAI